MAGLTTQAQTNILNWMKGTTWPSTGAWGAAPTTVYVGLFTTAPTTDASASYTGTEVSGNAYARQPITTASGWSTVGTGAGLSQQISNNATITFPTPTGAGWGTIKAIGVFDGLTTGNLLWWATIADQAIGTGVVASFAASALVLSVD